MQLNALTSVLLGIIAALLFGSVVRWATLRRIPADAARPHFHSLGAWWVVTAVVIAITTLGVTAGLLVFLGVSSLALREYLRLTQIPQRSRLALVMWGMIPASYLLLWIAPANVFLIGVPLLGFGLPAVTLILEQRTVDYRRLAASAAWGVMVTTYLPAYALLMLKAPPALAPYGGAEWFLLLVLLTESSDIAAALVGRRWGRAKLIPTVSPRKTWEGFLAGTIAACALAALLASELTPLTPAEAAVGGGLIAVAGLFGDLNISAVKRDRGEKDSGNLLPGQGGILDRIDSLTFAAPAFYYYATWVLGSHATS